MVAHLPHHFLLGLVIQISHLICWINYESTKHFLIVQIHTRRKQREKAFLPFAWDTTNQSKEKNSPFPKMI
jgi:hypothetical protein